MILSIKLHTLEVTLSSMTLRVLNLVQLRNWRLLGSSLKRSPQKLSWFFSYMQFGILLYPLTVLSNLPSSRYCLPMDSPRPILPAELEFFNKGTGRGKSLQNLLSINPVHWLVNMSFTVPLVVIFTKFDGQIASEYVNLANLKDEDKWERARKIAEITFQKVYLPKVLDVKYPPKAYVQLEGEDVEDFYQKKWVMLYHRHGFTREKLCWINSANCWCNRWWQYSSTVCFNTNE